MSRQQIKILQQMARDGVNPRKPFEFINGKFIQLDEKTDNDKAEVVDEVMAEPIAISQTPSLAEEIPDLNLVEETPSLVEANTSETNFKKKKSVKSK